MKKRITALALAVFMVLGIGAIAAGGDKTINVVPMTMTINGKAVTPLKSDGTPAEVFAYDGATYVPLRYLSELLGIEVKWDAENNQVAQLVSDKLTTPAAVSFKPGTYSATAAGRNGPMVVDVKFTEDKIYSVTVKNHTETKGIADPAINDLPVDIVDAQSIGVDAIAGATITSKAILAAVADCIKQAGGDPDKMMDKPVVKPEDMGDRTANVEVLVIGGGGTGLTAAISALDNGAKDILIVEKMPRYGGSTANSGAVISAEDTYYTNAAGIKNDATAWLAEWKASSDADIDVLGVDPGYPTYSRVSNYFSQVGKAVNWLEDLGIAHWVAYPLFPGRYQVPDYILTDTGADPEGGYMLTDHMVKYLQDKGVDMRLNTAGIKLLTNAAGDVIGATVQDKYGSYDVYASKGVVLATGGFAASEEMMREYLPQFADWIDLTTSGLGNTGDGMKMAVDVGGVMYNDPYVITLGSASRNGSINAFCMSVNLWGRLVVNSSAKRFFNEGQMPYQATVALSRLDDGIAWAIGDSSFFDVAALDAAVDGVEVVKADTIEDLAKAMGVDVAALADTVKGYNASAAAKEDKDFGKNPDYLTAIDKAPYYAVRIYVCTGGTIAGVKTNEEFQVLKADGTPIKGLWAGGETSNREMYAYAYSSGSGVGYAVASGREIGKNIMK